MRRNWRVAVLGAGMLSLLVAAGAWAAESRLQAFVARIQGLDAAGKRQAIRALTKAERKQMHTEYKALPAEGKKALRAALRLGQKGGSQRNPGIGTVQYDTGTVHNFRDNFPNMAGNLFNTGFRSPHTISVVTFQQVGAFFTTPVRVFGAPVGTVAPVLAATSFFGNPINTLIQWDLPNIVAHNGTFIGGLGQSGSSNTINTTFNALAVDVVVPPDGQGFHGMNINTGGSGFQAGATVFPGLPYNGFMRATGESLPVELMNFNVQ